MSGFVSGRNYVLCLPTAASSVLVFYQMYRDPSLVYVRKTGGRVERKKGESFFL